MLCVLLSSCGKENVEGTWHCEVLGAGRMSMTFDGSGNLQIFENGVHTGTSKYKALDNGDIRVTDLDGSVLILTKNEDGSLNFRNGYISGYFVKE